MAGHIGLELPNPRTNYLFEVPCKFPLFWVSGLRIFAFELLCVAYSDAAMIFGRRCSQARPNISTVALFNSEMRNAKSGRTRRHFALDFAFKQSMHGGHGHRA